MAVTKFRCHLPGTVATLLLVTFLSTACGSSGPEKLDERAFQKVTPSDSAYAIQDLAPIGFKKDKQYDVEGLPAGVDAWSGFWGPGPYDRTDFEVRFYASHQDAVEFGTPLAEEVTGEDAGLHRDNPTWKEGAKDRWRSSSVVGLTRGLQSGRLGPRYLDFAIYANMVILGEGEDSAAALARCALLVDALIAADTE